MRNKCAKIEGGVITKKAIALGTFDGLHLGHRAVLESAKGYELTVLTFRIPPKSIIQKTNDLLMLPEDKQKALFNLGAKNVVFLDFENVKDTFATDFLNKIFDEYKPDLISCGYDFHFGKDASGNADLIKNFCEANGIDFFCKSPVFQDKVPISSTNIRNLIKDGKIDEANKQIFGGFGFTSKVLHGDQRGRTIGFPTVNQEFPSLLTLPKFGVYSSDIIIDNKKYKCITNIGVRPTFKTEKVFCESHILDFSGDIYGKSVTLKPLKFVREEKKFNSLDELMNAIKNDIKNI